MSSFNKSYTKTASSAVELFYKRHQLSVGQKIGGDYAPNKSLTKALNEATDIYVCLYMKPVGDSILFLSIMQALYDYLRLTRELNFPRIHAQIELESVLKHCALFGAAIYTSSIEQKFAEASISRTVAMITDGDPFSYNKRTSYVFNTENYTYPKFTEEGMDYGSRPARYYLTFEREVGMVLATDPNLSMPTFEFPTSNKMGAILGKKKLYLDDQELLIAIIAFVNQKERQKQFGVIRYLKVVKKIQARLAQEKIKIILFVHKAEESEEWDQIAEFIEKNAHLNITIYNGNDLEEIGYILARAALTIGNDTGISHFAAVSRKDTQSKLVPTIITYSRHDFGKWSTGRQNVIPIYTRLAEYLTQYNMSVRRDRVDLNDWKKQELASTITIAEVVDRAVELLKK